MSGRRSAPPPPTGGGRRPAPPPPAKRTSKRNNVTSDFGVYEAAAAPRKPAAKNPAGPKRPARKPPPKKHPSGTTTKRKFKRPPSKKPKRPTSTPVQQAQQQQQQQQPQPQQPVIRTPPPSKKPRPKHLGSRPRPQSAVLSRKRPPVPQPPPRNRRSVRLLSPCDARGSGVRPELPAPPTADIVNRLRERSDSFTAAPGGTAAALELARAVIIDEPPPPVPSGGPPPLPSDATEIDDDEFSSLVEVLADVTLPDDAPKKAKEEMTKRERVIDELIHTEEIYVSQLRQLVTGFLIPLVEAGLEKRPLKLIFGNINELLDLQTKFFSRLERSSEYVADAFMDFASDFEIYSGYINAYDDGTAAVLALEDHHRLGAILANCSVKNASGASLSGTMGLESLRAAPLQRVPRYILLLREILKKTADDDPEREALEKATASMKDVANFINTKKRERERAQRLLFIREHLVGAKTSLRETKKVTLDTLLAPHKFVKRHTRKTRECELCTLSISVGASHGKCMKCKTRCHTVCIKQFPADCDGEAPVQLPHELLTPDRKIMEEATLLHKGTPLDQPGIYESTPFQERTVILFPDSLLILEQTSQEVNEFNLVELVKWCSGGSKDAQLEPNAGQGLFSLSSYKHGQLHTFKCEPEIKAQWVALIETHQQNWKDKEQIEQNHVQRITKRLEGMRVEIQGTVPVHSSYEKPFTVFMIHMTKEDGEAITILKRYRQLLQLHKVLQAQYGNDDTVKLPHFPSKLQSIFNMSEKVLQKRRAQLETYLGAMLKIPNVLNLEPVRVFLTTTVTTKNESEVLEEFTRKRHGVPPGSFTSSSSSSSRRLSKRISVRLSAKSTPLVVQEPETNDGDENPRFSYPPNLADMLGHATVVVADHEASDDSQLSVTMGEEIVVLSDDLEDDWQWCRKVETGALGYIPTNHLSLE